MFIYSEKATKFSEIFLLLLTVCTILTIVKSRGKVLQNFVAFSEYMNFKNLIGTLFYISVGGKRFSKRIRMCCTFIRDLRVFKYSGE